MNSLKSLYLLIVLAVLLLCSMSCVGMRYGCIKGNCTSGQGTKTWPSGAKYVGEWRDDKRNGQAS